MGLINEDVIDCKKCGESIVYEPAHEKIITCPHCGAVHQVEHTVTITLLTN